MRFEHAHERRLYSVTPAALLVSLRADCNQVHVFHACAHGLHPCRMRSQISSARRAASGVVRMRVGHGRMNPSDAHFRVASIPILLPYAGRSLASSRSSIGPLVNWMSRSGEMCVPTIHATSDRFCTSTSLSTTMIVFENMSCPSPHTAFMILRACPGYRLSIEMIT